MIEAMRWHFDRCWPFLEPAVAYSGRKFGKEAVWSDIESNQAVLWPGVNSAAVSRVDEIGGETFCIIWLAGGELEELKAIHGHIEAWARDQRFTFMEIIGRDWRRALSGYEKAGVILRKAL